MGKSLRAFALAVACLVLAGCDQKKAASETKPVKAGPPGFADIIADPKSHAGAAMEFKVLLAVGKVLLPTGETATTEEQSWEDPPGTPHSVAPGKTPDLTCVFVMRNDNRTPLYPIEPIVVDNMTPCLAGDTPPVLTGKVQTVRDIALTIDGKPATVKAIVLTEPNFKGPF